MFILGVIPARAGSKGIKDKNIYPLCGMPLVYYTVEAAIGSNLTDFFVYTDSMSIIRMCYCHCLKRSKELSQDDTPMLPVIQSAVKLYEESRSIHVDAVMILQPTSPLRIAEDIIKAIRDFEWHNSNTPCGVDSLYSGYYMGIKTKEPYDKHKQKPHFQRNGAIFITRRDLLDSGNLWSDNVIEFEMPEERSVDIDNMGHMFRAESLLKNGVLDKWI